MSRLATELIPAWLAEAAADGRFVRERLHLAAECWEERGRADDVAGAGLFAAVCFELGAPRRARPAVEGLLDAGVHLQLALQPDFLLALAGQGLIPAELAVAPSGSEAELVQRAARLARRGERFGVHVRRHGALLLSAPAAAGSPRVLAEGFNHAAPSLGPRGLDPASGRPRTFGSLEEAESAGLPFKQRRRMRPAQRHAEVHCLLQLPRLSDALGAEVLIAELADVGPLFRRAEPCSRGCMQLLMRHGVAGVRFTDGRGGLHAQGLGHRPDLDVAACTYASTSRLAGDTVSERACRDMRSKAELEASGGSRGMEAERGAEELAERGCAPA